MKTRNAKIQTFLRMINFLWHLHLVHFGRVDFILVFKLTDIRDEERMKKKKKKKKRPTKKKWNCPWASYETVTNIYFWCNNSGCLFIFGSVFYRFMSWFCSALLCTFYERTNTHKLCISNLLTNFKVNCHIWSAVSKH